MEEEIDRTENISYKKINSHYINSQIACTIKQRYTCIVYITCFAMKCALNAVGQACIRNKYYFYSKRDMIILN